MATIELKDIKKDYRNDTIVTHALSGVDLKIDAGEFVAIMGTSGSGKTTKTISFKKREKEKSVVCIRTCRYI